MISHFPTIRSIDDITPAVEGRKDVVVSKRDGYVSVFYVIHGDDTFARTPDGFVRRECRGLIFDDKGGLLARPFQKFFNVGEKPETLPERIDLDRPHVIQEKLDGTLIFPFLLDGDLHLATKAGITDEALIALDLLDSLDPSGARRQWLLEALEAGLTPCLEHIGDDPRRVLRYQEPELVLLAVRERETGAYVQAPAPYPGPTVQQHGSVNGTIRAYVDRVREDIGREGDVLVFENGERIKFKSNWFVRIHQVKDQIEHPRHIAAATLDATLDDMIGVLSEGERETVRESSARFVEAYTRKLGDIETMLVRMEGWLDEQPARRSEPEKQVALYFTPLLARKSDAAFAFARLRNRDVRDTFDRAVRKHLGRDTRFAELMDWFNEPILQSGL